MLRKKISFFKKCNRLKKNIKSQSVSKIILGCGYTSYEDWVATNVDLFDITNEKHWQRYFSKNSIDNLLAEHVLEHISLDDVKKTLHFAHKYLKSGGCFRLAVPDGYHVSEYYKRMTKPGGKEPGASDHKIFFTIDLIKELVDEKMFEIQAIEYFDRIGNFHKNNYSIERGVINRTAEKYSKCFFTEEAEEYEEFYNSIPESQRAQLEDYGYTYTSLFVDLVKK